jgi:hypothetical protein
MITESAARKLSPELQAALTRFAKTHARHKEATFKTVKLQSGETFAGTATVPRSIGEDYDEARNSLLTFRSELPVLNEIDHKARAEKIADALGDAGQDAYEKEYDVALEDIKRIEEKLAAVGLKLAAEKK